MASGAIAVIITSACVSFSGSGKDACSKAIEAGAKQTGIEQNVNDVQKAVERKANDKAHDLIGDTGVSIAGGGIFIVKSIADKAVKFNLPTMGICDRITNQVGVDKYALNLEWGF